MFGPLGLPEVLFIMVLALLVFGPRKLPEIGRTIGRGLAEFRKASSELKRTVDAEMMREELRQADPRRILREEPQPRRAAENPKKENPKKEPDETVDRRAQPEYEAPSATVARGTTTGSPSVEVGPDKEVKVGPDKEVGADKSDETSDDSPSDDSPSDDSPSDDGTSTGIAEKASDPSATGTS